MTFLHSIYLSHQRKPQLGWRIEQNIASLQNAYPDYSHTLFGMENGREFIRKHFDREVLDTFDDLIPLAYKADLLRYCILYIKGGVYSDLSLNHFFPLPIEDPKRLYVFRDAFSAAPWIGSVAFFYAPPKEKVFLETVKAIVANVAAGYYGTNSLCPTGPNLFGRMLAQHANLASLYCGEALRVSRSPNHALVYLDHEGELVAAISKRGAGLSSLGGAHDSYDQHYRQRNIYKNAQNQKFWPVQELREKGFIKHFDAPRQEAEIYIYGPYVTLAPGSYRATYRLDQAGPEHIAASDLRMDVCADCGNQILSSSAAAVDVSAGEGAQVSVDFELAEMTKHIEVRLFSRTALPLADKALVITPR